MLIRCLGALLLTCFLWVRSAAAAGAAITNDTIKRRVEMTGAGYSVVLDYGDRAGVQVAASNSGGRCTPIGSAVSINMAQGAVDPLGFKYVRYDSPVTLQANTAYHVLTSEADGGDRWYDVDTIQTIDPAVTREGGVANTLPNGSSGFTVHGGTMYGPVTIVY